MPNLFWGVDIGLLLVLFYIFARISYGNRVDTHQAKSDLKRQGYTQVDLEDMNVNMGPLAWGERRLSYTCGSFSINLALARVPRPDAKGFEWRPFLLLPNGGRRPVSTGMFSRMVSDCMDRASEAKDRLASELAPAG